MATKSRYSNPSFEDTVQLQFIVFNSNNFNNVSLIVKVDIYFLDDTARSLSNPDGRMLVQTIPGASVQNTATGHYEIDLFIDPAIYTETGKYVDEWTVIFETGSPATTLDQLFEIYPDLWYTTPMPVVYDFSFNFQPNKIRKGSKKYLEIEIIPNTPRASDLQKYYENLAIAANLQLSLAINCGNCVPCEADLRLLLDQVPVVTREKNRGFYLVDTSLYDCGIFDIWFTLLFGECIYVSDRMQLQIYA